MNPTAIINKKSVNSSSYLKQAQKQEKRIKGKGSRRSLKNYLGKVVSLTSTATIHEKSGITTFGGDTTQEGLLTAIEKVGLTGMSGNGFPVVKKIKCFFDTNSTDKILLINAVECDPALVHDEWLLKNRYKEITNTIRSLQKALRIKKSVLATKDKTIVPNGEFAVAVVPPRYPMGEEHFLIRQVLGVRIEHDEIPTKRGILVLNLQSVYQIGKIINKCYDGGRFVTLADMTTASAAVAYIYPNDNIANLLNTHFSGAGKKALYKGFGAMSCTAASKTDNFSGCETFAAYANPLMLDDKNKCRNCGRCTRSCPVSIGVSKIVGAIDKNQSIDFASHHPERCIECGSCTYFCPASKDVSGYVAQINSRCGKTALNS